MAEPQDLDLRITDRQIFASAWAKRRLQRPNMMAILMFFAKNSEAKHRVYCWIDPIKAGSKLPGYGSDGTISLFHQERGATDWLTLSEGQVKGSKNNGLNVDCKGLSNRKRGFWDFWCISASGGLEHSVLLRMESWKTRARCPRFFHYSDLLLRWKVYMETMVFAKLDHFKNWCHAE